MRNFITVLCTFVFLSISANDMLPIKKVVDTDTSVILWKGKKVTGSHEGTIKIKEGNLLFEEGKLFGGSFIVDMTSIVCTDLQGKSSKKLQGHLMSNDFFSVPNHPTASLLISSVREKKAANSYTVSADLTIKGITNSIDFDATVTANRATSNIIIDRTDFDIRYGSGAFFDNLGDRMIYDEFELDLDLRF